MNQKGPHTFAEVAGQAQPSGGLRKFTVTLAGRLRQRGRLVLFGNSQGALGLDAQKIIALSDRAAYIRRHFKKLIGIGITQNQAAQKYKIQQRTISRWVSSGVIARIGTPADDPTAMLIDEADVSYCADAYHTIGIRPGQKLFNKDGSLYVPKSIKLTTA